MANVSISVDGVPINVEMSSPTVAVEYSTPSIVLPLDPAGIPGPQGPPGPASTVPGPTGPSGPAGAPGPAPQSNILSGFASPPPVGGSGTITLQTDPFWASIGGWTYINNTSGVLQGYGKIIGVDHNAFTLSFSNWTLPS